MQHRRQRSSVVEIPQQRSPGSKTRAAAATGSRGGSRNGGVEQQGWDVNWDDFLVDAATDTGMRRMNNQDSHAIVRASTQDAWQSRGHLFMVADGMGAHAVGELASKLACDNIPHNYRKSKGGSASEAIVKAYKEVGGLIHGKATANKEFHGMGTTCSTLILLPEGALLAHVGDSRIYRVRHDVIEQYSFDHSLVWELVRRNHLSPDQASRAVPRNVITRSLGPDPNVEVDVIGPIPVEQGDVFLLCSDGLSGPVSDSELGVFAANFHPSDAARYVLYLANLRGGHDNITAVMLHIGQWAEPGTDEHAVLNGKSKQPAPSSKGWKTMLQGILSRKSAKPVLEPPTPHRTAPCAITNQMIETLEEVVRKAQELAIAQTWSLDWTEFAETRRILADAKTNGNLRASLKSLGEQIVMLGMAGRLYKKGLH